MYLSSTRMLSRFAAATIVASAAIVGTSAGASASDAFDLAGTSVQPSFEPSYLGFGPRRDRFVGGSLKDEPIFAPKRFNGCYIGVNAGGGFDDTEVITQFNDVLVADIDNEGFVGGLHIGCNNQYESDFLLGLEGDLTFGEDEDVQGSIRIRWGIVDDNVLYYATLGVSVSDTEYTILAPGFFDEIDDTQFGVVAGAGIELKVSDNLSLGLEGLYYNYGTEDHFDPATGHVSVEQDVGVVRGRLTFHFGSDAPAPSPISDFR